MSSSIPDTESSVVARIAAAWNIVAASGYTLTDAHLNSPDERAAAMTEAFIKTYNALIENDRKEHGPKWEAFGS